MATMDIVELEKVLTEVLTRVEGKGLKRHGGPAGRPFHEQDWAVISTALDTENGLIYQALKKTIEATRLPTSEARVELLDAIAYLGMAILFMAQRQVPTKGLNIDKR